MTLPTPQRRFDLDWLRIAAFGLLILYHVGMFYVTWDWHVKSDHASAAIEPLMRALNPWRLTLLFLISGVATRFMADKMQPGALAWARLGRLVPPLILAILVIVPPQTYYEVVRHFGPIEPGAFYQRYITASGNWCGADGCLITPTYNHMWFVAYLIVYTLIAIALAPLIRRAPAALSWLICGPGLLLTPWLFFFTARVTLEPIFGDTHALVDDWYLHAIYLTTFLFGFGIAKFEPFFAACVRQRWLALGLAVAAYATLEVLRAIWEGREAIPGWLYPLGDGLRELQAWGAIVAAFGFAHLYLANADTPIRRYFTLAIFPFYLLHQTIIVVAGYNLNQLGWPPEIEAPALIALTLLGCWLGYELVRRVAWLRVWFGLPSRTADSRATSIEISRSGAM
jgi:hypothetical protein